jgi:glycosyltransferase involved in cell wall biosynthesis
MIHGTINPLDPTIPNRALSGNRTIRILQVVNKMDRGGAETWLMHILRHIDRQRFHFDFLVHDPAPGAYNAEAQSLGARIIYCPYPSWPWTYARRFKKILADYGPYDIIQSHLHSGGFHLGLASQAGVPVRISHNHSAVLPLWSRLSFSRRFLIKLSYKLIFHYATSGLAASRLAAAGRFGPDWEADPRWQVLYCGIDLDPFRENLDHQAVRHELGVPAGVPVIGHVGNFGEVKNHRVILRIASELARLLPDFRLLLVGQGPLRPELERLADQAGLRDKVIFAGLRADVPRLMLGAMDVFVFPSFFEGLPLALLEAQAAGLPCLLSDTIPAEADVVAPLIRRLSLAEPAARWAEAILAAREATVTRPEALKIMERSHFNIESSCRELVAIYQNRLREAGKPDVQ